MKIFKLLFLIIIIALSISLIIYNNKTNLPIHSQNISNQSSANIISNQNSIKISPIYEDELLINIKKLSNLSIKFKNEYNVNDTSLELCLQFIRKNKYVSSNWNQAAGQVNIEFIDYIKQNNYELFNYDFDSSKILDKSTNNYIDFPHLCATLNSIIYKSLVPSDFSGWAGDLTTLMGEIINYDNNKSNGELINFGKEKLGAIKNSSFNLSDMIADVNAVVISKLNYNDFYSLIAYYYYSENDVISNRMHNFKIYLGNNIYEAVQKRFNGIINQTIINQILTDSQSEKFKKDSEKYINIISSIFDDYFKNY